MFAGNPFKEQIISTKVPDGTRTTVYRCGDLVDLCRGPHLPNTGRVKAFAATRHSATNWLGDTENDSLQRMYGVSFPDKKMLKVWKENQEKVRYILCFYCGMGLLVAVIRINESHYLKTRNERINLYPYYFMSHLMFICQWRSLERVPYTHYNQVTNLHVAHIFFHFRPKNVITVVLLSSKILSCFTNSLQGQHSGYPTVLVSTTSSLNSSKDTTGNEGMMRLSHPMFTTSTYGIKVDMPCITRMPCSALMWRGKSGQ